MGARLNDKTKKKIIADRLDGLSIRKLAAKYGVSRYAIELAIKSDPAFSQKMTQKKEENTQDMLDFLESRKIKAQNFVDLALDHLQDPAKLDKASVKTIATALGIVIDKFTALAPKQQDDDKVVIVWGRE